MLKDHDDTQNLQRLVQRAVAERTPLRLCGGGSKSHLLPPVTADAQLLSTTSHVGIEHYAPEELVVTVRAGTPVAELQSFLAANGQALAFDPPQFNGRSTIGGAIAAGLAGPGRPWRGAARDAVLGVTLLNGRGELLRFGGQVMKNVAGYDLSRLQVGACGTFGLLLAVSLRLAPQALVETTYELPVAADSIYAELGRLSRAALPISAVASELPGDPTPNPSSDAHEGRQLLRVRLSGTAAVVADAAAQIANSKGELRRMQDGVQYWASLRDLSHPLLRDDGAHQQWRVSLPLGAPTLGLTTPALLDWGGALRWLKLPLDAPELVEQMLQAVAKLGGHARRFGAGKGLVPAGPAAQAALLQRLREAFDEHCLFNPNLGVHAD